MAAERELNSVTIELSAPSGAQHLQAGISENEHDWNKVKWTAKDSAPPYTGDDHTTTTKYVPNGFVQAVCTAYNEHRHLHITPDDVWIAILVQFAFYTQANAAQLRSKLVSIEEEEKKKLTVISGSTFEGADWTKLSAEMTQKMAAHLKDDSIRDWVCARFSTTTDAHRAVYSFVLMGAMSQYFKYEFVFRCGIPKVTLHGCLQDWENLLPRIDRLAEFDTGDGIMTHWADLLRPVVQKFAQSFMNSKKDTQKIRDFWRHVCDYKPNGSGSDFMSGWITVFCVFDEDGKYRGNDTEDDIRERRSKRQKPRPLDEPLCWPVIRVSDIPAGYVKVQAHIVDDFKNREFDVDVVAGHTGIAGAEAGSGDVQPIAGWAMVEKADDVLF